MRLPVTLSLVGLLVAISLSGASSVVGKQMSKQVIGAAVGQEAPDFTLPDSHGKAVSLGSFKNHSVVVLFFYPKDNSMVCTKEACLFRDSYEDFTEAGATVVGISSDSAESHQSFAKGHSLPFVLLTDKDEAVRKQYQVKATMGLIPGRATFVIDKTGIIRHRFDSQLDATKHVQDALETVKKLRA
jgi:peroxiredoxin Q/BCP